MIGTSPKKTVSLFFIDTSAPILSQTALNQCARGFSFDEVLIFTNHPEFYPAQNCIQIPAITSSEAYSEFLINKIPDYIRTDFIIIAHYDGFILNPQEFSPNFYHYDYIGAPWPTWSTYNVGNGGFCWRSRRLCHSIREINQGLPVAIPEDLFICRVHRTLLEEKYKCRFADAAIASHFSFEMAIPPFPTFGFHGSRHLPAIYRNNLDHLIQHIPDRLIIESEEFLNEVVKISPSAASLLQKVIEGRADQARRSRLPH
jgi:hypothetical protein